MTVEIGTRVALFSGWDRRIMSFSKVAKIYKNGNIVLEGSSQQYRKFSESYISTSGGWRGQSCQPVTPEIEAEYAAQCRADEWRKLAKTISDYRMAVSDEMLSAAKALVAMIEAKP